MTLKITLTIAALLAFRILSPAQTGHVIPRDFVEITIDKISVEEKSKLNFSHENFEVSQKKGKLIVSKWKYQGPISYKLPSGVLIGNNRGEWGGELNFQPKGGKDSLQKIKNGNITAIFNYMGKIYSMEGIAHLGYNQGAIFELHTQQLPITYTKIFDFEDAPKLVLAEKDRLIIVSHQNLYLVNGFDKELVFEKTIWGSLYPNSITKFDEENIFIGMRAGIAKVDLKRRILKFYKYIGK